MEFGVTVPNNWGIENVQEALAFGPLAEELGYDSVWVMDHLFNNGYIRERLDDRALLPPAGHLDLPFLHHQPGFAGNIGPCPALPQPG